MKDFLSNLSRATKNVIIGCLIFLLIVIIIALYLMYSPVELSRDSGRIGRGDASAASQSEEISSENETTSVVVKENKSESETKTEMTTETEPETTDFEFYDDNNSEESTDRLVA